MNVRGVQTLFAKEVRRFLRVPGQTVLSPLVSTSLYFIVFGYALKDRAPDSSGMPYLDFIVPGLVFLGIANNAFLNSSSSLFITKIQGTVVDLLVAPLGARELLLGFIGGAMVRGLVVGLLTWAVAVGFVGLRLSHGLLTPLFLIGAAYLFSVLGFLAGLWAEKFEQINFFPNFVMLPLTFLGGVFYSVTELPSPWDKVSQLNPMVYMVDALRYAMLGQSSFSPWLAGGFMFAIGLGCTLLALAGLRSGYKLKS